MIGFSFSLKTHLLFTKYNRLNMIILLLNICMYLIKTKYKINHTIIFFPVTIIITLNISSKSIIQILEFYFDLTIQIMYNIQTKQYHQTTSAIYFFIENMNCRYVKFHSTSRLISAQAVWYLINNYTIIILYMLFYWKI